MKEITDLRSLNDFIDGEQQKRYELEREIDQLKYQSDAYQWAWCRQRVFVDEGIREGLPSPRLEMIAEPEDEDNWYGVRYIYGIVYGHYSMMDKSQRLFIPISETTSRGGIPSEKKRESFLEGYADLPFRDGVNIKADMVLFGFRAFLVTPSLRTVQEIVIGDEGETISARMYAKNQTTDQ